MSNSSTLEVVVIGVDNPAGGTRQRYGLLVGQVHSIVRIDDSDKGGRVRAGAGGWELAYEDGWVPLCRLGDSIGLGTADTSHPFGGQGATGRVLGVRLAGTAALSPAYIGFAVDEVIEIRSLLLDEILPFPHWVIHHLPPSTVWGAVPAGTGSPGALLLLLDGMALAGRAAHSSPPGGG